MAPTVLGVQKISDRTGAGSDVALQLGNRSDLSTGAPTLLELWMRNAYINLCQAYNFEGLEYTVLNQISGVGFMNWPTNARAIKSLTITDSNGSVTFPDFKDIQTIRRMASSAAGLPSVYTIFANQILFAPAFDTNVYNLTLDLWQRALLENPVKNTLLLLPDDWYEALDFLTIMRGHAHLGEVDKALAVQRLLYGYTDPSSGQHVPGMLYNLQMRSQANAPARDYGLQPRSNRTRYTT